LQHIIGATAIPVEAIGILVILVACMNPVTIYDILGPFVLVPIVRGRTVSANQQIANVALFYRVATFIGNQCLVARHEFAGASRLYLARTVTDKNMQNLRAADTIENIYIEFFLPTPQDISGQSLTGRDTNTNGGEIEAFLGV